MKILIITGCVYSENCNRTDFTGLDYVVGEIVETIGKLHEVDVFTLTPYPKTAVINNGRIYSYTYGELVKYISPNNLNRIKKIFFQCNTSFKSKIKAARSILVVKEIERLCKNNRYDVIHVHGLGFSSFLIAEIGMKIGIPVLYTLHGLLGYKDPSISTIDKKSEHKMLEMLRDGSHIVTCVSGGIKKVICKDVGLKYENVFVS